MLLSSSHDFAARGLGGSILSKSMALSPLPDDPPPIKFDIISLKLDLGCKGSRYCEEYFLGIFGIFRLILENGPFRKETARKLPRVGREAA
mmetsp:Transcript_35515/g.57323  ORF Transcript_35515/g.57323 Transcript_35515/m.57323 type:complete len:91 (+) Transcript_35515:159-431(+)